MFKKIIIINIIFGFFALSFVSANLKSPFAPTVPGLCIPNAHQVDGNKLYRSMRPYTEAHYDNIKSFGFKKILIFKTDRKGDVLAEQTKLSSMGYKDSDVLHIDFPYRDLTDFKKECLKTVKALKFVFEARKNNEKLLLHCTVGEDRTGVLSGLIQLMLKPTANPRYVFYYEMCDHGYGGGNPEKPIEKVVKPIRETLTPFYIKMAYLVKTGKIKTYHIDEKVCDNDPQNDIKGNYKYNSKNYVCYPRKIKPWTCKKP